MMSFKNNKVTCLAKKDKSKKGTIDKNIEKLIDLINQQDNYYTTSSCSGRIVLLNRNNGDKKHQVNWLLTTHDKTSLKEIKKALEKKDDKDIWLMQEAAIIHICCKTIEDAIKILNIFKENGFKRSGINSIKNKIIVELISTEHMDTIIAKKGEILTSDEHLEIIIDEANKKLNNVIRKIKKIEKLIN